MSTFFSQFSPIVYITSKFNFCKKNEYKNLLVILVILNKSKKIGYFVNNTVS